MHVHSFAPIVGAESRLLILGSMPGEASLRAGEYYAHPRNLFWPLMEALLAVDAAAPYRERVKQLRAHRVALWDVLQSCTRETSLDSDIVSASEVPNDLPGLFDSHASIHTVALNGRKAASLFRKHVVPRLPDPDALGLHDLPSTSPANASIPYDDKLAAWRAVLRRGLRQRVG